LETGNSSSYGVGPSSTDSMQAGSARSARRNAGRRMRASSSRMCASATARYRDRGYSGGRLPAAPGSQSLAAGSRAPGYAGDMVLPHDEPEARRRFTADEVMQMVRVGILGEDDRLELIDGE